MKKIMNILAFILIVGFVGAWESGDCEFKTMLFNSGITLSVLFGFHLFCFITKMNKELKRLRRHKISHGELTSNRVKIS
ncbi:MAG: hypothetical protein IKV86_01025 [Clostridia bacterium]|nr:hypothetical protein [Clostridia bacterium]